MEDARMIYELRTYRAVPGRMADLLARFRDHTCPIWTRLGIKQIGYWTVLIGESHNDLIYLLAWDSLADRESRWAAFCEDPEWMAALAASEINGPLITSLSNQLLAPTAFSPLQ
jgi:hypothetical protein